MIAMPASDDAVLSRRGEILAALRHIRSRCAWTEGNWEGLGLGWDEVQSVSRHIRGLADLLIRFDYESTRGTAG